jgi:hypothetical protein
MLQKSCVHSERAVLVREGGDMKKVGDEVDDEVDSNACSFIRQLLPLQQQIMMTLL